ncbi:hypothetical protein N7G274_001456 [Stereocaulon virgatum]|uniref:Uncharacterized protein n=1 Tax=Stereocaulon virgatum TaxID=373712 RepID=A0ABR4AMV0_9LECA
MPIKIPKGFQRRKSSGNALEDLPNPPEPSFRVFERPQGTKSFDGGNNLKRMSLGRPVSAGHFGDELQLADGRPELNPNNRGSGGTNNSASSGGHNDNSSSSARYSSTSTLPSSTDIPLDENFSSNVKGPYRTSAPPIPETSPRSLRAAGRALSFGRKKVGSPISASQSVSRPVVEYEESNGYPRFNRPRAMTESSYASGSTATPPKLPETGLDFGQPDLDGFGSMFESFGKRQNQIMDESSTIAGAQSVSPVQMSPAEFESPPKAYIGDRSHTTPSPPQGDHFRDKPTSPHSRASGDSQKILMASNTQRAAETLSYYNKLPGLRPGPTTSKSRTLPLLDASRPSYRKTQQRVPSMAGGGLQRSSIYASKKGLDRRSSDFVQDEDARLVMDSLNASQRLNRRSGNTDDEAYNPAASLISHSPYLSSDATDSPQRTPDLESGHRSPAPLFDSSDHDFSATPWRQGSTETTPRAKKISLVYQDERSMFDISPPALDRSPPPPPRAQSPSAPENDKKIMTPAQFEQYRKEQEARREQYFNKDESDEEGDDYEDDDEIERNKQLARERRKQEAHLSVYRQQMMKVTGEQPSDLPSVPQRPGLDRSSMSAPAVATRSDTPTFSFDTPPEATKASDDEDEDVPLGVLAAHGFPSKNRPPTATTSNIQYNSESYPPPPKSVAGSALGAGRSLPPFAKHLPSDPYFGAGLVNTSIRESLAYGNGGPQSVHGGSSSVYGVGQPNLQPGGLVGVIAEEERARAARRGSPNAQGNYGSPLPPNVTQMPWGMPLGMSPTMSAGEQATVQMSEQMKQMMQMQMQWMQQMQQMMASGMQGMPPGQQPPFMMPPQQQQMMTTSSGMLAPPGQQQRPLSSGAPSMPTPLGLQQAQQRAMSMMDPSSTPPWQAPGNNRMSKAPSMMSGALGGSGPGYAPSLAPSERSNVGMPSRYRPVSIAPSDEHVPRAASRSSTLTSGMLLPGGLGKDGRLSVRPVTQTPPKKSSGSDDDDEEGWEEMKKKREKSKSTWRLKKKRDEHGGLETYEYPNA